MSNPQQNEAGTAEQVNCWTCGAVFTSKDELEQHKKLAHENTGEK